MLKFLLLLVLALAAWLAYGLLLPLAPQQQFVLLRPGWSTRHIARELKSAGIIRSEHAFLLYHYAHPGKSLKAGEYKFDSPSDAQTVYARLTGGDIYFHQVVIPEGYNMFDVARTIDAAGLGSQEEFLRVARSPALISDLAPRAKSLEGYLFPDTYQFTRTQTMEDIATVMVRRFRHEAKAIGLLGQDHSLHQIVTLASIIEKETAVPEERPTVASVYSNRLARKIALAADPSVIYASILAGRYDGNIRKSDLQLDSPYNTYKFPGLPPGPIANPSRASLEAALHPAQTDFLYFVSDGQGRHRFSRTLEEHSRNVAAYLRRARAASQNR